MSKISDEIKEQILPLYEKLHTYVAVARELGISPTTVSRYVKLSKDEEQRKKTISSLPVKKVTFDDIHPIQNLNDVNWKEAIILSPKEWEDMPYERALLS